MYPVEDYPTDHHVHADLLDRIHSALKRSRDPARKAEYGNVFAKFLSLQAKAHAAHQTAGQGSGAAGGPMPIGAAEDTGREPGYVDQNISPMVAALIASGGTQGLDPGILGGMQQHPALPLAGWNG